MLHILFIRYNNQGLSIGSKYFVLLFQMRCNSKRWLYKEIFIKQLSALNREKNKWTFPRSSVFRCFKIRHKFSKEHFISSLTSRYTLNIKRQSFSARFYHHSALRQKPRLPLSWPLSSWNARVIEWIKRQVSHFYFRSLEKWVEKTKRDCESLRK